MSITGVLPEMDVEDTSDPPSKPACTARSFSSDAALARVVVLAREPVLIVMVEVEDTEEGGQRRGRRG